MTAVLSSVLTAIAIPLVFWWLSRKYPAPELSADGPTLAELSPKYGKWELGFALVYIVSWFPISAAVYAPLHFVAGWRAQSMQSDASTFVFYADGAALWIPAFFMALLLSGYAVMFLLKRILKERYSEYERYGALKFGFDQRRVMKGLGATICVAFVIAVIALFDTYVVASKDLLRINPLLGLERQYAYSEIAQIVTAPALIAPNGNTVYRRVFLLKFKDGTMFSTDSIPEHELLERSQTALIQAIVERSGLQPFEKPIFERGDL